jgi:hypothetical protein
LNGKIQGELIQNYYGEKDRLKLNKF